MAVTIDTYYSEKIIEGAKPSIPDTPETEIPPVLNPPGTGNTTTYKQLGDTTDKDFIGKDGFVPVVVGNVLTLQPMPNATQDGLISGGVVQWTGIGYDFNISAALSRFQGVYPLTSGDDILTSPTADPTDPRIDNFILQVLFDGDGIPNGIQPAILDGVPAVNPVKIQINPATQIELTQVLVPAGSITPTLTEEVIYDENVEWTGTSSGTGTANFSSATNPFQGSVSVETTNIQNGFYIQFDNGSTIDISDYQTLGFQLDLKASMGSGQNIFISFLDGSGVAASTTRQLSFDKSSTDYQFVGLVLSSISFTTTSIRYVRFSFVRYSGPVTHTGYFLDILKLEGGINPPVTIGSFLGLSDTPSSYLGQASKVVSVSADETRLEFTTPGGGGSAPVAGSYASQAAMIAAQGSQTAQYIYFDSSQYWEYLGTTAGMIADYRKAVFGVSPYDLAQEGAGDGDVLTWVSANSRYEPVTPSTGSNWTLGIYGIYRNSNVSINYTPISTDVDIPLIVKPSFADNPPTTNDNNLLQIFGSDGTKRLEFQNDGGLFVRSNAISGGDIFSFYNGSGTNVFNIIGTGAIAATGAVALNNRQFRVGSPTSPNADITIKATASLAASSAFRIDSGFTNGLLDIYARGLFKFYDGATFELGTTTGTKIGTATTQKISFWNKTPIIQPTTAITGATLVSNAGTTITSTDTFGGYTLQKIAAALINVGILA